MSSCTIDVCSITVSPSSWQGIPGESFVAYATVYPSDASDKTIQWVTNDARVATVTADGLVVAQGRGTTRISAVARDGSMVYGSCTVTVTPKINVTSVELDVSSRTMNPNTSFTLTATVCPLNASSRKILWSSSDESVATVSGGRVCALRPGTATITAMANDGTGKRDCCRVTVKKDTVLVSSVSVSPSSRQIAVGESFTARATVCPEGAENRSVCWTSSNTNVATVNPDSGLVIGRGSGSATIRATAKDGSGHADCCSVTVSQTVKVSSVTLNRTCLGLEENTRYTLSATVCPVNAANRSVSWWSSNTNVATVNNGVVCALKEGTATITAAATDGSGVQDCCTVTVTGDVLVSSVIVSPSSKLLYQGESVILQKTICPPDATDRRIVWNSNDASIATVNPATGMVLAQNPGTTKIYAISQDKGGQRGYCTVTVDQKEKVNIVKDGRNFEIRFATGLVWKNISFDLANEGHVAPQDVWDRVNANAEIEFTERQLGFVYLFDPYGVAYYLLNYAYKHDLIDSLFFKDNVFQAIYGQRPRFFKIMPDDSVVYFDNSGTIERDFRNSVFSDAEIIFGSHPIYDKFTVIELVLNVVIPVASVIFGNIESIFSTYFANAQLTAQIINALFFAGSVTNILTDVATDFVEDYLNENNAALSEMFGWASSLFDKIDIINGVLETFSPPNLGDIDIYFKVNEQGYKSYFEVNGSSVPIEEIIKKAAK